MPSLKSCLSPTLYDITLYPPTYSSLAPTQQGLQLGRISVKIRFQISSPSTGGPIQERTAFLFPKQKQFSRRSKTKLLLGISSQQSCIFYIFRWHLIDRPFLMSLNSHQLEIIFKTVINSREGQRSISVKQLIKHFSHEVGGGNWKSTFWPSN